MPLPDYSPRSDSFGNWYYGGFQLDDITDPGYGAGTTLTPTQANFDNFLDAALGSSNWIRSSNNYYLRFANSDEPLTGTITTTAEHRFRWVSGNPFNINTSLTGTPVIISTINAVNQNFFLNNNSYCAYAVANQYGMWLCTATKGVGSNSGTLGTAVTSAYMGWTKDPVFPFASRLKNIIAGSGSGSNTNLSFISANAHSSTVVSRSWVNSVITCDVATPGANVSDLCFISIDQANVNIGSAHNALFYPGTGLTVGQIYRIPPADDPDGNTEQNIWLCAGQAYGWDGSAGVPSAGYKLIRVWSNNIT